MTALFAEEIALAKLILDITPYWRHLRKSRSRTSPSASSTADVCNPYNPMAPESRGPAASLQDGMQERQAPRRRPTSACAQPTPVTTSTAATSAPPLSPTRPRVADFCSGRRRVRRISPTSRLRRPPPSSYWWKRGLVRRLLTAATSPKPKRRAMEFCVAKCSVRSFALYQTKASTVLRIAEVFAKPSEA